MEVTKPLGYLLSRSMRMFKNQVAAEFKSRGIELSFEQYVILHMINSQCDLIQQDPANYLQKDKSIIVRQIDSLIEKEYLVRQPNLEDKRKKNILLTEKGLVAMNEITQMAIEVSNRLLHGVSDEEFATFKLVLNKIQENGEKTESNLNNQ